MDDWASESTELVGEIDAALDHDEAAALHDDPFGEDISVGEHGEGAVGANDDTDSFAAAVPRRRSKGAWAGAMRCPKHRSSAGAGKAGDSVRPGAAAAPTQDGSAADAGDAGLHGNRLGGNLVPGAGQNLCDRRA